MKWVLGTSTSSSSVKAVRFLSLWLWALFLTGTTFVFGVAPLYRARRHYGRALYWLGAAGVCLLLLATKATFMAVALSTSVVLVGLFFEFEELKTPWFYAVAASLMGVGGLLGTALALLTVFTKVRLAAAIKPWVTDMVVKAQEVQPALILDTEVIYRQLPSMVIALMIVGLLVAVVVDRLYSSKEPAEGVLSRGVGEPSLSGRGDDGETERRRASVDALKPPQDYVAAMATGRNLVPTGLSFVQGWGDFHVPDFMVWLACAAALLKFSPGHSPTIEAVGANMFNVIALFYFLQGLSVVAVFFRKLRLSAGWQGFWYFLIVFQFFLVVSVLGFVDYWADFRRRISGKMAEMN